eukprot:1159303-Pelagomonas_calceolata.AAC.9
MAPALLRGWLDASTQGVGRRKRQLHQRSCASPQNAGRLRKLGFSVKKGAQTSFNGCHGSSEKLGTLLLHQCPALIQQYSVLRSEKKDGKKAGKA